MVNFTLLAGGYSQFIATYIFNSDDNTLSFVGNSTTGGNPSWITLHPTNKSILYATNENTDGGLQSFHILEDGLLSEPVGTYQTGGDAPAFAVALSTGQVAVMNYNTGNGKFVPTEEDPLDFVSNATLITFPANVSHPHMAVQHGDEVLVPDLGADKIWRLIQPSKSTPADWVIQGQIEQPEGSGPRHIALADGYLYTLHELSSTLTSQILPKAPNGTSSLISNSSIVPPGLPAGAAMAAGEILIPSINHAFSGSYVYVSNRNTGVQDPRGDAIAIYSREKNGSVSFVDYVFTGIDQIRGMEFFGDDDQYLIASGVAGEAGVLVFERTGNGGNLTLLTTNKDVPTRTSFVWVN